MAKHLGGQSGYWGQFLALPWAPSVTSPFRVSRFGVSSQGYAQTLSLV